MYKSKLIKLKLLKKYIKNKNNMTCSLLEFLQNINNKTNSDLCEIESRGTHMNHHNCIGYGISRHK